MIPIFKSSSAVIAQIEGFLNLIDESSLVFTGGIKAYLKGNREDFVNAMDKAKAMEEQADDLRRKVTDSLYRHSLMPDFRGDVLHLMELMDDLVDIAKENLLQFDVEEPYIPGAVHEEFNELAQTSAKAVEAIVLSVRTFFRDPKAVKDMLHRVYFYEHEADRMSSSIKRKVYKEISGLDLSQKNHLRHFIDQAENLSDVAEKIADIIAILAIKRSI